VFTCLNSGPCSATNTLHASRSVSELYLQRTVCNTEPKCDRTEDEQKTTKKTNWKQTHKDTQTGTRREYQTVVYTYRAHSSMNFPMFSSVTIFAAACSHSSPRSDRRYSLEVSRRAIIAAVSHLFKSVTVPTGLIRYYW
jgi:hypothetical protein